MFATTTTTGALIVIFFFGSTSQQTAGTKFSCQGRAAGYYADVDSGCQIYHMCDGLGRQFSYSCPNTTLFQQRMLICDHWYMVNCSTSEIDYSANLLIGQKKPFVEDSEKHPYHRTPRPDLLSQPTAAEFDIIYRKGEAQNHTDLNLVGANFDFDQNNGSSKVAEKPAYQLPSHWSTEYSVRESVTLSSIRRENIHRQNSDGPRANSPQQELPPRRNEPFVQRAVNVGPLQPSLLERITQSRQKVVPAILTVPQQFKESAIQNNAEHFSITTTRKPKAINFNSNDLDNSFRPEKKGNVNFRSTFKATTPVYPSKEELGTTESPLDDLLVPPQNVNFGAKKEVIVNFGSNFRATTPVYPSKEELGTTEIPIDDLLVPPQNVNVVPKKEVIVNFGSNFKATTPVYPNKEQLGTTEIPIDDLLVPPRDINFVPKNEAIVNFESNFKATTPVYPSKEELGTTEIPIDELLKPPKDGNFVPKKELIVNFKSEFKATTPVFPTKEELVTTEAPVDDILKAPDLGNRALGVFGVQRLAVKDADIFPTSPPIRNVQPPFNAFSPANFKDDTLTEQNKYTVPGKSHKNKNKQALRQSSEKILKDLRKMFSIPDYEFPLDTVSRPGYDKRLDSFQVNPFFTDVHQRQHASE